PIDDRIKELGEAMASQFPGLRDRAVEARKRDAASEVHLVKSTVAKWGATPYSDQLEKALAGVFPPMTPKSNGNLLLRVAESTVVGKRIKKVGVEDWSI